MPIITSKKLKQIFESFLIAKIQQQNFNKKLEIIQIGQNLASGKYINIKQKIGKKIGLVVNHHHFLTLDKTTTNDIIKIVEETKKTKNGLIFQLPVEPPLDSLILETPLDSDVDLLGKQAYLLLEKGFLPPTVGAVDLVLKEIFQQKKFVFSKDFQLLNLEKVDDFQKFIKYKLDFSGLNVAIVGQGKLVGKPSIKYFLDRQASILSLNKSTKNIQTLTKIADIVICGAGSKKLIDKSWLKNDSIVIDASTSESNGKLEGDVNKDNIHPETSLSPSPGGIGKLTVLYLFWNLLMLENR